jgi:hypothetical protein
MLGDSSNLEKKPEYDWKKPGARGPSVETETDFVSKAVPTVVMETVAAIFGAFRASARRGLNFSTAG